MPDVMTLPAPHRTMPLYTVTETGERLYSAGCNCGWRSPVKYADFERTKASYSYHVEGEANRYVEQIRAGQLVAEEYVKYVMGLDE